MTPQEIWLTIVSIFFLSVWTWMCVSITVKTLMRFRKKKEKKRKPNSSPVIAHACKLVDHVHAEDADSKLMEDR